MKVIRLGIFETNSSSTHAISIPKNEKYTLPKRMTFKNDGEFDWEYDILEKRNAAGIIYIQHLKVLINKIILINYIII